MAAAPVEPAQEHSVYSDSDSDEDYAVDPRAHAAHELIVAYWNTADRTREIRAILDAAQEASALAADWAAAREAMDAVLDGASLRGTPECVAMYACIDARVREVARQAHVRVAKVELERATLSTERSSLRRALVHLSRTVGDALFYG